MLKKFCPKFPFTQSIYIYISIYLPLQLYTCQYKCIQICMYIYIHIHIPPVHPSISISISTSTTYQSISLPINLVMKKLKAAHESFDIEVAKIHARETKIKSRYTSHKKDTAQSFCDETNTRKAKLSLLVEDIRVCVYIHIYIYGFIFLYLSFLYVYVCTCIFGF